MKPPSSAFNGVHGANTGAGRKLYFALLWILLAAILISVLQDYVDSARKGFPFHISESLLFKSVWLLFPPILWLLKSRIERRADHSSGALLGLTLTATAVHAVLTSVVVWFLSFVFREQSYAVTKVLSFTLANDVLILLLVYAAFIGALQFLRKRTSQKDTSVDTCNDSADIAGRMSPARRATEITPSVKHVVVNTGKNNTRIHLHDIVCIRSATPYVSIQVNGAEHLHTATLKSMAKELDDRFVRVHRSCIVNTDKVQSFQSRLNGDYDLILEDGQEIRLSRNYVKAFKQQFGLTPQLKT